MKFLEGVSDKLNDIYEKASTANSKIAKELADQGAITLSPGAALPMLGSADMGIVTALSKIRDLRKDIAAQEAKLASTRAAGDATGELERELLLYKQVLKTAESYSTNLSGVIAQLATASGITDGDTARLLSGEGLDSSAITVVSDSFTVLGDLTATVAKEVDFLGLKLKAVDGVFNLDSATAEEKKFIVNTMILTKTLNDANAAFERGNTTSEKLAAKVSGASATLKELTESGLGSTDAIAKVTLEVQALSDELRQLQNAEKVLDGIQKAFSGAIGKVDTAAFSGVLSITGKIAENTEQMKGNQLDYLASVAKQGTQLRDLQKSIEGTVDAQGNRQTLTSAQTILLQAGETAQKAIVGVLLENLETVRKIKETEQQRSLELENQLKLLQMGNLLSATIASNTLTTTESKNTIDTAQRANEISRAQLVNTIATNDATIARMNSTNAIADVEAQIGLIQGNNNAAAAYASLQALKNTHKILHAERELAELQRNPGATSGDVIDKRRDLIELERKVLTDNYNNQKAAIMAQGSNAKAALAAQKASVERQKTAIDAEITFKNAQRTIDNELFREEIANTKAKIQADIDKTNRDINIIEQTRLLDNAKIAAQKAASDREYDLLVAQLKGYNSFATSVDALNIGLGVFATVIAELLGVAGDPAAKAAIEASAKALPTTIQTDITGTIEQAAANKATQDAIFQDQKTQIDAIAFLSKLNKEAEIAGLEQLSIDTVKLKTLEQTNKNAAVSLATEQLRNAKILLDLEIKRAEATAKVDGGGRLSQLLELQAQYENSLYQLTGKTSDLNHELDIMKNTMLAVKSTLQTSLTSAFMDLNSLFYETGDNARTLGEAVQDSFYNIFKAVQETFFQKAIAEPIALGLTDFLSGAGLFGSGGTKGADNALVIGGALLTTTAGQAGAAEKNPIVEKLKEGDGFFARTYESLKLGFNNIFGSGGFLSGLANSIFGQGGVFATALSGLGNFGTSVFQSLKGVLGGLLGGSGGGDGGFISGIFKAGIGLLTGAPAMASGGIVQHMAQGGGVNSLRDRVPAMLEPGEFVLRKQAARSIGGPGLQAMNSGGGGGGNVVVNIKNEGTPQDAQASQPKFDGEKFVIDIVTRDLSNNGPIRRQMRAGT
jgi:hypothetical protein